MNEMTQKQQSIDFLVLRLCDIAEVMKPGWKNFAIMNMYFMWD